MVQSSAISDSLLESPARHDTGVVKFSRLKDDATLQYCNSWVERERVPASAL